MGGWEYNWEREDQNANEGKEEGSLQVQNHHSEGGGDREMGNGK